MTELSYGSARCNAVYHEGSIVLSDLTGEGSPEDLLALIRSVQDQAKETKIYLSVDTQNPRMEQLMRTYVKLGAKEVARILEVI